MKKTVWENGNLITRLNAGDGRLNVSHPVGLLPEGRHRQGEFGLWLKKPNSFRLDALEDLRVQVHGPNPHAHRTANPEIHAIIKIK